MGIFGRSKKKDKDSIAVGMNENYVDNSDLPDEVIQQGYRPNQVQPIQQQQMNQPVQPMYYQQPMQVQPVQQFQQYQPQAQPIQPVQMQPVQKPRTAIIVKTELQDNGEFVNTVITNYQLNIGYARLEQ